MLAKSQNQATQEAVAQAAHMNEALDRILKSIFSDDEIFESDDDKALCTIVGVMDELDRAIEDTDDLNVDSIWMTGVLLEISDFRDRLRARTEPYMIPEDK